MDEQDDDVTQPKRPAPKRPDQSRLKVTKEELDKSGLSLRDYMNKQLGLKRRDGSAPAPAPAPAGSQVKSVLDFDPSATSAETLATSMKRSQSRQRASDDSGETAKVNAALAAENKSQQASGPIGESDWAKSVRASQANGDSGLLGKRMREAMGSKYAKGGKVSASSRGDGIAQRGKTRGKLC
jgi:hypothetical protein